MLAACDWCCLLAGKNPHMRMKVPSTSLPQHTRASLVSAGKNHVRYFLNTPHIGQYFLKLLVCQDIVHKVRWQLADNFCHVIGLCCCLLYTVRISSFKFDCFYTKCELELENSVLLRILKVNSCHLECISFGTVLYNPSQHVFKFSHTTIMHIVVSDINEVWLLHRHTHWKVYDLMCCEMNYQFSMPPNGWYWETLVW
jgi:hypothetical protein